MGQRGERNLAPLKGPFLTTVNIHAAKTHFSSLVEEAAKGEEIIIAKAGKPAARLIAPKKTAFYRKPGRLKHLIEIHRNFDDPLPPEIAGAKAPGVLQPPQ
jgi:prevent-host-death family protein